MGILDFLGDLSSKRSKELGLGGLQSLLGTRGAAKAGDTGDEMMKITGGDSLPGYYNQETREYVPWYVDLFDGGGLNAAGGAASAEAAGMPAAGASLLGGGAQPGPNVQPGPALGSQLSDMERLNRMPGVDPRNLGGASGYGPMGVDPRNLGGASGYGQTGVAQQMQPVPQAVPRDSVLNDLRRDVYTTGPIEAIASSVGDNFQVPKGFNQNVRGSDGTSFIPYGVPKPGEGLGVETFGSGNAYSNQHYSVDPAYPAFIKSFPQALEQPSIIPLLLAQYKAKRGL